MDFLLTILGSSAAIPANGRGLSAQVLQKGNYNFLIDCGEGTQFSLIKNNIKSSRINHIFISHLHGDHIFGLPGFLSTLSIQGRKDPMYIYGPNGLRSFIEQSLNFSETQLTYDLVFEIVDTRVYRKILSLEYMEVYSIPLRHRIPCAGYKFVERIHRSIDPDVISRHNLNFNQINQLKKAQNIVLEDGTKIDFERYTFFKRSPRSYAYVSDTKFEPAIVPYIDEVSLLFHEATYTEVLRAKAEERFHSTALQAASIAGKAKAGKLILGHISSRYKNVNVLLDEAKSKFSNTEMGLDGNVFKV